MEVELPAPSTSAAPATLDTEMSNPDPSTDGLIPSDPVPPEATETIYLNNLNEHVKITNLKQTLRNLFKNYGPVLDVVAHSSVRMRGQAFVAFPERAMAAKAVKEIKGFPLYGKPIEITFAKTRADEVVKRKTPTEFDEHKSDRLQRKKLTRSSAPLRKKYLLQRSNALQASLTSGVPLAAPTSGVPAGGRRIVQMPDEYLPPNKILFVQNLPDGADRDALEVLFKQYSGLVEVRTIPGRTNIAFVEYQDATLAGTAKDALHNYKFGGEFKIKVTFAKQ